MHQKETIVVVVVSVQKAGHFTALVILICAPRVVNVDHPWPGVLSAALPLPAGLDAVRGSLEAARVRAGRRPTGAWLPWSTP